VGIKGIPTKLHIKKIKKIIKLSKIIEELKRLLRENISYLRILECQKSLSIELLTL